MANSLPALLDVWNADVVALQECRTYVSDSARILNGWHWRTDENELCLLSRYPIQSIAAMDRSILAGVRAASAIGGAGHVVRDTLTLPSGTLTLTNLRLESVRKGFHGVMRGSVSELLGNSAPESRKGNLR